MKDAAKVETLYQIDGLYALVKKYYPHANADENALLMEFVLHGLAAYSLISKKSVDGKLSFNDLMGSMMNFDNFGTEEEEEDV
jgi:magnesium chelatase subunit I